MARAARSARKDSARPPAARVRLDVDARRAQLLELGLAHFGRRAYDDVSIDAIADAAGISKGLLYHYFPTKRAFYAATVREAAARLLQQVEETETAPDLTPLESLHRALEAYLDYVRDHGPAFAALMRSGIGMDPEIARIVDETRATFVARLMDGFRPALPSTPVFRIALRGWVGLAETTSLAWVEALAGNANGNANAPVPQKETVRDLLASALLELVRKAAESR